MSKRKSINEVITNPEDLNYDSCWSFYDWFCKEQTLERRAKSFISKLKFLVKEGIIDGDKVYVWFKNNCPLYGNLYDDMRFCTMDKEETYLGGISPRLGYTECEKRCLIWTFGENGNLKNYEFVNWAEAKKAIKNNVDGIKDKLKERYSV